MSYCRFSSDDWLSDLYVYGSAQGWEVVVATRRSPQAFIDALPPAVVIDYDDHESITRYIERSHAVLALHKSFDLEPIDLPHAGDMATFDTADEAADACEWLAAVGFHVPRGVVEALRTDADRIPSGAMS